MDESSILKELADAVVACDPPRAKKAAETALAAGMDPVKAINEGLVVGMGVIGDNYAERKMYLPQVLVAAHSMYEGLDVLIPAIPKDENVAAKKATQHLIETGSRRIAFLGGPNHLDMVKRRKHGYLEALRDNRIPIDRELVVCNRIDFDTVVEATTKLLQIENRPDAILAVNDTVTFAAFTAIKEMGLRIPEDVALIGFTDDLHARYVTPQMSAIEDQSYKMGCVAYDLLQKSISGDPNKYKKIVPQKLVIRGTSDKHGLMI